MYVKSLVIYLFTLIIVSVAPPPASCEPVRGWSKKATAKAADEDSRAGEGGDGEVAFDDSEGDDDDDDDDSDDDISSVFSIIQVNAHPLPLLHTSQLLLAQSLQTLHTLVDRPTQMFYICVFT